jgi:hypothetical protein
MDSTSLCLKYSWPLKDRGVFVESAAAGMVRKNVDEIGVLG